uniref:Uncharacterized protein n=1 Tax=Ixodes ricinus TaxID=34613 RepID=A0A0K8R779_IXORI
MYNATLKMYNAMSSQNKTKKKGEKKMKRNTSTMCNANCLPCTQHTLFWGNVVNSLSPPNPRCVFSLKLHCVSLAKTSAM